MNPQNRIMKQSDIHARVDVAPNGCWNWRLAVDRKGYGVAGCRRYGHGAHRLSYSIFVGPIPDGLVIDHLCRNPQCVNPAHLEPVTSKENSLRGVSVFAINARKIHCKRGHELIEANVYVSKLGERVCRECRRFHARQWRETHPGYYTK